jgi:hypothetical protein
MFQGLFLGHTLPILFSIEAYALTKNPAFGQESLTSILKPVELEP